MLTLLLLGVSAAFTSSAAASIEGLQAGVLAANPGPRSTHIGVYRPGTAEFFGKSGRAGFLDVQDSGFKFAYGSGGDIPVIGDWDGNGTQTHGVFRAGRWILSNTLARGSGDLETLYGQAGDRPIVGDWDGNGVQTIGLQRGFTFFLSNSNTAPSTAYQFTVGEAGDIPVVGDWDGDGADSVGVYRSGTWYLRNRNSPGHADITVDFGSDTDLPVVGDWDSDGRVSIGYFGQGNWYLSQSIDEPEVDIHATFGQSGDRPVVGNWGPTAQLFGTTPASLSSFFPIAVDFQPASQFSTWKSRGVNTVIRVPSQESVETWTSTANALGLKMIRAPRPNPALDDAEPNLLAFTGPDEPELTGHTPDSISAQYSRLKASAPSKPLLLNFAGASVLFDSPPDDRVSCNGPGDSGGDTTCITRYIGGADWVSHDIYPVNADQPIGTIGRALDRLRRWSRSRPQFAYIEAADLWNEGAVPHADEFRGEIWQAIVHGARGISYFVVDVDDPAQHPDAVPEELVTEMEEQNARITQLAGVLQTSINPPVVAVKAKPPLEFTWRQAGAQTYVIVLNQSGRTVNDVPIRIFGAAVPPAIAVWNENRTVTTSGNGFTDSFGPYAVHVYQF
jgi:hypothetical protein